jgi:hypothetical protein
MPAADGEVDQRRDDPAGIRAFDTYLQAFDDFAVLKKLGAEAKARSRYLKGEADLRGSSGATVAVHPRAPNGCPIIGNESRSSTTPFGPRACSA